MKFVSKLRGFFKKEYRYLILKINQSFFYHIFLRWVKHLFKADVYYIKVHHRKLDRPIIVVANHVSGWDPFLIFSAMPRNFFFNHLLWRLPAYYKHFWLPYNWLLFKFLGVYPIKPVRVTGSLEKSLEKTIKIIQKGQNLVFFPEGKRVASHEQARPKRGIAQLIKITRCYLLPVYIDYYQGRKKKSYGVKITARVKIFMGDIIPSEYFLENHPEDKLHEAVMDQIKQLPQKVVLKDPSVSFQNQITNKEKMGISNLVEEFGSDFSRRQEKVRENQEIF